MNLERFIAILVSKKEYLDQRGGYEDDHIERTKLRATAEAIAAVIEAAQEASEE